ncbi:MAG TPA: HAMP domain-containing sensor histidine kinase [Terriglobales bacterium]|nr:HAMP domain-containing sensor histidine kinase [Terriglobales bacterium]
MVSHAQGGDRIGGRFLRDDTRISGNEDGFHNRFLGELPVATQDDLQRWCKNLSTAAHDLKTPLAVLGGYIDLLLGEKLGKLNRRQREMLHEMKRNEARLQRFIKDFITFSAAQTTPLQLTLSIGDIADCIKDITEVWRGRFQEREVALLVATDAAVRPFAFDYYKVQHITSNLLDNALKFSPRGSTVLVRTGLHCWERRSCVSSQSRSGERRQNRPANPNSVRVTVIDNGPGIAPEFHSDIFRDFFRLAVEDEPHGTGLGLAIARRLVHLHGGVIWVESEPGAGSRFSFLLPIGSGVGAEVGGTR